MGDSPITPRLQSMMEPEWGSLLDKPSSQSVDRTSRQLYIEGILMHPTHPRPQATELGGPRITLNFPTKGRAGAAIHKASSKRKATTTIEPLRSNDTPGDKATNHHIQCSMRAQTNPPQPALHMGGRISGLMGTKKCTLGEALEQYTLGFDITSITILDDEFP